MAGIAEIIETHARDADACTQTKEHEMTEWNSDYDEGCCPEDAFADASDMAQLEAPVGAWDDGVIDAPVQGSDAPWTPAATGPNDSAFTTMTIGGADPSVLELAATSPDDAEFTTMTIGGIDPSVLELAAQDATDLASNELVLHTIDPDTGEVVTPTIDHLEQVIANLQDEVAGTRPPPGGGIDPRVAKAMYDTTDAIAKQLAGQWLLSDEES